MVREELLELHVSVPSQFRCPISMEVMRSPVSLCTGVTYDRSSIQPWLDSGHDTCPATMLTLPSKDVVPNLTLRRLINLWPGHSSAAAEHSPSDLLRRLHTDGLAAAALLDVLRLASSGEEGRREVAGADGVVSAVVGFLAGGGEVRVLETAVRVLDLVPVNALTGGGGGGGPKRDVRGFLASILAVLREGRAEAKAAAARVLMRWAAAGEESRRAISDDGEILDELVRLLGEETAAAAAAAAAEALAAVAATRTTKARLAAAGAVGRAAGVLEREGAGRGAVEKAMRLAAVVATCAEGRAAMAAEEGRAAAAVARRLVSVSGAANEDGVAALWAACCGGGGSRAARVAAARSGGVAKLLLVMQSGCSDHVRRMCFDLLRVLREASPSAPACGGIGLESYQSRACHIMPY